ncbi:SDR family oxidoreductase [Aquihabitans daechungensis]|uniref:SDR family oxidoreductase n=1 Tax=Aquihabitans daechungensis TaxID=1052257 RepID=UPI003BA36342
MRALVTGAGSGIGRATAEVLTEQGHEVVATARRVEALDGLDVAQRLPLDVTSDESVAACAAQAGAVDVLVNNAGITETGPLETYPHDVLLKMFETNVFGPMRMIRAFVPAMRERGHGVVVNVTSVEGKVAAPLAGAYCGTKHALEALSESLAFEVGHFGVRVVIVEPGYIAPGMRNAVRHGEDGTAYEELRRQWSGADETMVGPGGRPGPELVGHAIADAIADASTPLRVPVGADAEMVLATRKQLGDADFTAAMRDLLGLTW